MKLRALVIVTLIVLIAVLLWALRLRESQPTPVTPTPAPTVEKAGDDALLAMTSAEIPGREPSLSTSEAAAVIDAHADFALLKVLVLDKTTRAPRQDIDVYAIYDTGFGGHRIESTKRSRGKPFENLHTDADGRVEIEIPPNVASKVTAHGHNQDRGTTEADVAALPSGATHDVVLELPTGDDMPFWMKFVDETSGTPIANVRVSSRKDLPTLTSDAQGLLLWQAHRWSPGMLQVDADGYAHSYLKPEPGHAEPSSALVVTLARCANVNVHVVDASGHSIVGARVELVTPGYSQSTRNAGSMEFIRTGEPHLQDVTDRSGHVTIACLPPHVAIKGGVLSPKEWSAPDKLVLEPGETRVLEWKITDGCDVHGIVLDQSNAPVKEREMWLRKSTRTKAVYFNVYGSEETRIGNTDAEGRFRFSDVSAGQWWIGPSAAKTGTKVDDDDVAAVGQPIEIADGQSTLDITLRVDRGLFIRGIILNAKGEPTDHAFVDAYDETSKLSTSFSLAARDNAFALGPLMAGHYRLRAHGSGGDADSDPVEASAGASKVVLQLRPGAALSGKVFSPSGEPVPARIWMTKRDSTTFGGLGVTCNNVGDFRIEGLDTGMYDMAAITTDGATGLLEGFVVRTGESTTGLEIRLHPGGHVRVRHEGPEQHASVAVLSHGVMVSIGGLERSTSGDLAAPAGTVTVQMTYFANEKRVVERTVEVKAGQTVDVTFEKDAH